MRKEVVMVAVAAMAICAGILAYYAYSTASRKDTIASVNPGTNNSMTQNATMIPPSDHVTLQVLDNNGSSTTVEGYILPIHITHKLDLNRARNGYLAIFPIVPMWPYSSAGQEKQYFFLQDENGKDVSGKIFFYREGVYAPTAICKPKSETGATSTQIEAKIGFPMTIPVDSQQNSLKGEHLLYARYNIFGLGPSEDGSSIPSKSSSSTTQDAESKAMSSRYNFAFSSFNDVKIELPNDAKIVSTTHSTCVTASDNPNFQAWNVNFYNVVFELEHK